MKFARHKQVSQAVQEGQTAIGSEWSPDDRIELGPAAEPIDPSEWPARTAADSGSTRRGFLGGMLALAGVGAGTVTLAAVTTTTPLLDVYRRIQVAQRETKRVLAMPGCRAQERSLARSHEREDQANLELVRLVCTASKIAPGGFHETDLATYEPVATHHEGDHLFLVVVADNGSIGTCGMDLVEGRPEYFVRPIVVELVGGRS